MCFGGSTNGFGQVHVEDSPEDHERLLSDCGLEWRTEEEQLAIGLVGGSESEHYSNFDSDLHTVVLHVIHCRGLREE